MTTIARTCLYNATATLVLLCAIVTCAIGGQPTAACCWDPAPQPDPLALSSVFSGTVTSVKPEQKTVLIAHDGKEFGFRFSERTGAPQQRALLRTLKPGDTINATKMTESGQYHFDTIRVDNKTLRAPVK